MEHRKVSQFWVSESGASITGKAEHGYYAVCSCGAEVYSGPAAPHDLPKPDRLEELQNKELLTESENRELETLWEKWDKEWREKLNQSVKQDKENMLLAIERHAKEQAA